MPGKKTKPKSWTEIWKSLIALVPVGICITLYLARPYLETSHNPIISCVICDNQQDIRPPTSSHDYGATVELTIENTGSSATRIVEHNLSWWSAPETLSLPFTGLPESRDTNDDLEVPIGAHSSKILKMGLNEATIYILRHPHADGFYYRSSREIQGICLRARSIQTIWVAPYYNRVLLPVCSANQRSPRKLDGLSE